MSELQFGEEADERVLTQLQPPVDLGPAGDVPTAEDQDLATSGRSGAVPSDLGGRARLLNNLQKSRGNEYVQQMLGLARLNTELPPLACTTTSLVQPVGRVQRPVEAPSESVQANNVAHGRIRSAPGKPIDPDLRHRAQRSLGPLPDEVRVHADDGARQVTDAVDARAATIGSDIYVAPEEYRPGSAEYERMLAHELVHVAQTDGKEGTGSLVSARDDAHETHAESAAMAVAKGEPAPRRPSNSNPARVHRVPRPFNTHTEALRFDPAIDMSPVIGWVRAMSTMRMHRVGGFITDSVLDRAAGNPVGQMLRVPSHFQRTREPWITDEFVWDPGALYAFGGLRMTIELLEDSPVAEGRGTDATVTGSQSGTNTVGTSQATTRGVTGTASVTAGDTSGSSVTDKPPGASGGRETGSTSGSTGSATLGATASSSTTVGSTGTSAGGGTHQVAQASTTTVYTSQVYLRTTIRVRQWDFWSEKWSRTHTTEQPHHVGGARYTRADLNTAAPAPVAAAPTP